VEIFGRRRRRRHAGRATAVGDHDLRRAEGVAGRGHHSRRSAPFGEIGNTALDRRGADGADAVNRLCHPLLGAGNNHHLRTGNRQQFGHRIPEAR
jgi:hypothetical protein